MRLVSRQELMNLPEGTVYRLAPSGSSLILGHLMVKGDTIRRVDGTAFDWYEWEPGYPETSGSDDLDDLLTGMKVGDTFAMDDAECRDGFFDDTSRYLVLEHKDVLQLVMNMGFA